MPKLEMPFGPAKQQRQLDQLNNQLAERRDRMQAIEIELRECWREDGSITRKGLLLEQHRLDEVRRGPDIDPEDHKAQTMIHGQQFEVTKLLTRKDDLERERKNIAESVHGMELEAAKLAANLNSRRRSNA